MSTSSKVSQLQLLQQNLQNILLQKQQVESSLVELASAYEQLQATEKAYKIIGKIMLAAPREDLLQEIKQKKEIAEIRLKNVSLQEENIKRKVESVQQEAVQELKSKKS